MKKLSTILLLIISMGAFAQDPMYNARKEQQDKEYHANLDELAKTPLPMGENGKIAFVTNVDVPGKTTGEIRTVVAEWFANTFVSENSMLRADPNTPGRIWGTGRGTYSMISRSGLVNKSYEMFFSVLVDLRDGGYTLTITDIKFDQPMRINAEPLITDESAYQRNGSLKAYNRDAKIAVLKYFPNLTASLNKYVVAGNTDKN